MIPYLKLMRFPNLLLLALTQIVFKYGLLDLQSVEMALNGWQYGLLVLSTVCIAAGGYVINDLMDRGTDGINKPGRVLVQGNIGENSAYNLYAGLNIVGVALGFYLANVIGKPAFAMVFIAISATLYLYATSFRKSFLTGNILIAIISAMTVIVVGIFELYPKITPENQATMQVVFKILLDYALFCFLVSLLREITKDAEDIAGDTAFGMNTLPIVLGLDKTRKILLVFTALLVLGLLYYINLYYITYNLYFIAAYMLLLVVGPLVFFAIKIASAENSKDFGQLAKVLKAVLFFGIISILVLNLNIRYA